MRGWGSSVPLGRAGFGRRLTEYRLHSLCPSKRLPGESVSPGALWAAGGPSERPWGVGSTPPPERRHPGGLARDGAGNSGILRLKFALTPGHVQRSASKGSPRTSPRPKSRPRARRRRLRSAPARPGPASKKDSDSLILGTGVIKLLMGVGGKRQLPFERRLQDSDECLVLI